MWLTRFGIDKFFDNYNRHERKVVYSRLFQFDRAVHRVFQQPDTHFKNAKLEVVWQRFYWGLRTAQFKILYKNEETDLDSISDLLRYEPPTKPPTMEQLMESTKEQFSKKWIKYMYSKFKCECPDGRMKLTEFKNLFSFFVPNRISDAYLERMFKAICYNSVLKDQITFRDFMESLAMIQNNTPKSNAEWTIRLINPRSLDRVTFEEFHDFVKSIFLLVGGDNNPPVDPIPLEPIMDKRTAICIKKRAYFIFNQMDTENCGFIGRKDLERFFATHQEAIMTLSYQFVL